jgi:hypothetical protein
VAGNICLALSTGPVTSYVVISDPDCIKQVLFNYGNKYIKGTIAEAGEFLFGLGVALQAGLYLRHWASIFEHRLEHL